MTSQFTSTYYKEPSYLGKIRLTYPEKVSKDKIRRCPSYDENFKDLKAKVFVECYCYVISLWHVLTCPKGSFEDFLSENIRNFGGLETILMICDRGIYIVTRIIDGKNSEPFKQCVTICFKLVGYNEANKSWDLRKCSSESDDSQLFCQLNNGREEDFDPTCEIPSDLMEQFSVFSVCKDFWKAPFMDPEIKENANKYELIESLTNGGAVTSMRKINNFNFIQIQENEIEEAVDQYSSNVWTIASVNAHWLIVNLPNSKQSVEMLLMTDYPGDHMDPNNRKSALWQFVPELFEHCCGFTRISSTQSWHMDIRW